MCLTTPFGLRDRKNKILPLLRTGNCLTEIFNSQHLILIEFLSELKQHRKFALRLGKLADAQACYTLRIDVVLDPLGAPIKEDLFEHIDGLRTCDNRYINSKQQAMESKPDQTAVLQVGEQ